MKIVSFNINGIRARPHQLEALKARHDPDIVGLQESKVADDAFPREMVEELGYETHFFGQKSHYGVALMSKQPPLGVIDTTQPSASAAWIEVVPATKPSSPVVSAAC